MGHTYERIDPELAEWIEAQRLFFVATAPSGAEGHINASPKGHDTFRILGPLQVGYLDLTGSGAETIAHLRENGRVTLVFCAFEGAPKIVRLYGTGRVLTPESEEWATLRPRFPEHPGARTLILIDVTRVSDACGYGVPRFEFAEERDTLEKWAEQKGRHGVEAYRTKMNQRSIDGLDALRPGEGELA